MADGISYNALNLSGKEQLDATGKAENGQGAKASGAKDIDYNDGLTLFEMEEIDKKYGNGDGQVTMEEFMKAYNGDKNYKLTKKDKNGKSDIAKLFNKFMKSFKKMGLKDSVTGELQGVKGSNIKNYTYDEKTGIATFTIKENGVTRTVSMKGNKVVSKTEKTVDKDTGLKTVVNNDVSVTKTTNPKKTGSEKVTITNRATDGFINSISYGDINIEDIGTGGVSDNWFVDLKLNGVTYQRTDEDVKPDANGAETYTLKPYPDDGSSVVCKMEANGKMSFTIKSTDGKITSKIGLLKDGTPEYVSKYDEKGKLTEKAFCNENRVRTYERDENGHLISSTDYAKKEDGTLDKDKPLSAQSYTNVKGLGDKCSQKVVYSYDENGKQKVEKTITYDFEPVLDEDGNFTGEYTKVAKTYAGEIEDGEQPIGTKVSKVSAGKTQQTESTSTNQDGSTVKKTVTNNADGTKTVVVEDTKTGKITTTVKNADGSKKSVTVEENGTKKVTNFKDGEKVSVVKTDKDGTVSTIKYKDGKATQKTITHPDRPNDKEVISYASDGKTITKDFKTVLKDGKTETTTTVYRNGAKKITKPDGSVVYKVKVNGKWKNAEKADFKNAEEYK